MPDLEKYPLSNKVFQEQSAVIAGKLDALNVTMIRAASSSGGLQVKDFKDVQTLVRLNLAKDVFAVGDQFSVEAISSLSIGIGSSTGITAATINEDTFIAAMGTAHFGVYEATYDGSAWHKEDGTPINLTDYGISVTGTPAENDHVIITEATSKTLFDVMDHNNYTTKDTRDPNTMLLTAHNVVAYGTMPFSAPQLLAAFTSGLPAGAYKFTLTNAAYGGGSQYNGTYMFTLTQAIPANGGLRHTNIGGWKSSYAQSDVIGNYLQTYNAVTATASGTAIETVAVALYDNETECVDLGTFTADSRTYYTEAISVTIDGTTYTGSRNFTERNAYGSNRYSHSVYHQWLNSAAPAASGSTISTWWSPKTVFDRVPGGASLAGYLHGMDPDFVNAVGEVAVKIALANCDITDPNVKYETVYAKFFLLSRGDVYGSAENGVLEAPQADYYVGTGNDAKIKYQGSTARYWWLRTPHSGWAYFVRGVSTGGSVDYYGADNAGGVVPACCICGKAVIE